MRKFTNILIANRGEIALRIIATARQQSYRSIAVYSEADAGAPHVQAADEAVLIGPAASADSYLSIDKILAAAKQTGAEAIHPGYGFLSENAEFARACEQAGLVFIGPSAEAISLMGNKAAAKRCMQAAGVPCVPGFEEDYASDEALIAAAQAIGFPVMVKAAAGGGGRGMALVGSAEKLPAALQSARSVALNSFASDQLILEKAISNPRHVEIQVFADSYGQVVHLGERDCSIQRRHQKVVEEAPCPVMDENLRTAMGDAAVEAARAINYCGAGTVEFLLDAQGQFYFLEMNTRLQVEHPVTELITGLDLVALQLKIAQGEKLDFDQSGVNFSGHAIEVRLYAEDTSRGFLPKTGQVALWQPPQGEGVRCDAGIVTGQTISPYYDPMLAKIMAWGESREIARQRLLEALKQTVLFGTTSNRDFLIEVLQREDFAKGLATTAFIEQQFSKASLKKVAHGFKHFAVAALLLYRHDRQQAHANSLNVADGLLDWSSNGLLSSVYCFGDVTVHLKALGSNQYQVDAAGESCVMQLLSMTQQQALLKIDNRQWPVYFMVPTPGEIFLSIDGVGVDIRNHRAFARQAQAKDAGGQMLAPMHGVVQDLFVNDGDVVKKGHRLAVVEAMKMQHDILASRDGVVKNLKVSRGAQVAASDVLMELGHEL